MTRLLNLLAMAVIFGVTSIAWIVFAAVMLACTEQLESSLQSVHPRRSHVGDTSTHDDHVPAGLSGLRARL
jgi:L-lactate permease